MACFSFIHCSDLHLGCQQFNNPIRWQDFVDSFSHIVDTAISKKVDFLLIGGDLFHHRSINARTLGVAMNLLRKLKDADIKVFAIEGNHDKAFYLDEESWMEFLNKIGYITLLKPVFNQGKLELSLYNGSEGCMVEMKGFRIIGLGYLGATTRQRLEEASEQLKLISVYSESDICSETESKRPFTIVLLHAAVDKLLGQDMAGVGREVFSEFEGFVDYFALGHIHGRQEYSDFIFNPGAPESAHIDEVRNDREKGFYYVRVEGRNKEVVFCPSRRRDILYIDVDLTGTKLPGEALDRTMAKLKMAQFSPESRPIVQIILHGSVGYNSFSIDTNSITDHIKDEFGFLEAEVVNNVNLHKNSDAAYSSFDRDAVEKLVISDILNEEKPELASMRDELTNMILNLKNSLLAGTSEKDVIKTVEELVDGLPEAEESADRETEVAPDEN